LRSVVILRLTGGYPKIALPTGLMARAPNR
jgi:hypothetical protein